MTSESRKREGPSRPSSLRGVTLWILVLSAAITTFLFWLIYYKPPVEAQSWVSVLPAANALFNFLSGTCVAAGYVNIKRGRRETHKRFMLSAVTFSILFLTSYIVYHYFHGDTPFPGQGWIRPVYFFILISHIVLSMAALPIVLGTLYFALRKEFFWHKRLARFAVPIWLYVSATGVLVFILLSVFKGS